MRMSNLQNFLKALHKTRSLPEEMYLGTDNKHQPKRVCTKDDFQRSELFNQFCCNVFNADGQVPADHKYGTAGLNYVKITEHEIKETLFKLDMKKAWGLDNIGNIILKNLPGLSKSLLLVGEFGINKGCYPKR